MIHIFFQLYSISDLHVIYLLNDFQKSNVCWFCYKYVKQLVCLLLGMTVCQTDNSKFVVLGCAGGVRFILGFICMWHRWKQMVLKCCCYLNADICKVRGM